MFIGVGTSVPEISNLPGSSRPGGGGGSAFEYTAIDNSFSMEFDGAGSYFETGITDLPAYVSISLWVKSTSAVWAGSPSLVTRRDMPYQRFPYSIFWNGGSVYARFRIQSTNDAYNGVNLQTSTASGLNDGQWHHIAAFFDGAKGSLYVDGSEVSTVLVSSITGGVEGPLWPNGNPNVNVQNYTTWIGKAVTTTFDGKLDEVAIWNSAISENTIQAIYDTTANNSSKVADLSETPEGAPVAWYRMGD